MGRGTVVRAGEAAYTTGDWWLGSWKRGGPRKARTSKDGTCGAGLEKRGGRTCGAWKSMGLEKQLDCEPGKAEVRGRGADNNWRHDEGWRLEARDWRQERKKAGAGDSGRRSRRQRQPNGSGVLFFLRSLRTVESGAAEIF